MTPSLDHIKPFSEERINQVIFGFFPYGRQREGVGTLPFINCEASGRSHDLHRLQLPPRIRIQYLLYS